MCSDKVIIEVGRYVYFVPPNSTEVFYGYVSALPGDGFIAIKFKDGKSFCVMNNDPRVYISHSYVDANMWVEMK